MFDNTSDLSLEHTGWAVSGRVYLEHQGSRYSIMMENTEVDGPLTRTSLLAAVQIPGKYPGKIVKADLDVWKVFGGFITRFDRNLFVPESYQHYFHRN